MTDFRYLLTIYVHAHETGNSVPPHIDAEARAALAQPETAGPADEEIMELMPRPPRQGPRARAAPVVPSRLCQR
jgi:hypothetical protein